MRACTRNGRESKLSMCHSDTDRRRDTLKAPNCYFGSFSMTKGNVDYDATAESVSIENAAGCGLEGRFQSRYGACSIGAAYMYGLFALVSSSHAPVASPRRTSIMHPIAFKAYPSSSSEICLKFTHTCMIPRCHMPHRHGLTRAFKVTSHQLQFQVMTCIPEKAAGLCPRVAVSILQQLCHTKRPHPQFIPPSYPTRTQ